MEIAGNPELLHPNSVAEAMFLRCVCFRGQSRSSNEQGPSFLKSSVCPILGAYSPGGQWHGRQKSWALVRLGQILPHHSLTDPFLRRAGVGSVRYLGLGPETWQALMGFFLPLSPAHQPPTGCPNLFLNSGAAKNLTNLVSFKDGHFLYEK